MKTEHEAWDALREHGASRLKHGFAERVLRAARAETAPLFVAHFALCAATAALCLTAVAIYRSGFSTADADASIAGWNAVAAQVSDLEQGT
ncbi:MAG TPA: hypothetical protein VGG37_01070 [Opitutaceae bacterium]|jgi:hypothetical protein